MPLAHMLFDHGTGSQIPAWLNDAVLLGVPGLALMIAILVLEARTRPTTDPVEDR